MTTGAGSTARLIRPVESPAAARRKRRRCLPTFFTSVLPSVDDTRKGPQESPLGRVLRLDDLEDVAVGVAEEEPGEGRRSQGVDQGRSMGSEAALEGVELGQ